MATAVEIPQGDSLQARGALGSASLISSNRLSQEPVRKSQRSERAEGRSNSSVLRAPAHDAAQCTCRSPTSLPTPRLLHRHPRPIDESRAGNLACCILEGYAWTQHPMICYLTGQRLRVRFRLLLTAGLSFAGFLPKSREVSAQRG